MTKPLDWSGHRPPSLAEFEEMARTALEALPDEFRALAADVGCAVADFPEDEVLDEMGIESPFDLLGLFHGIGRTAMGDTPFTGQMPNRVWLYRRPILDYWAEHETLTLQEIVTHVLVHELGHHFGFSDEDMEAIEAAASREDGQ